MLQVLIALVAAVIGVLIKGLLNLSLAEVALLLAIPFVFLYKLFGNRPGFLVFAAMIGAFSGGAAAFWGYMIVPIQYYYSLWGWRGVVAGVIAAVLLPLELVLFFVVAFFKGGAAEYIGKFLAGICFGFAGLFLFSGAVAKSPWSWLPRGKGEGDGA
jgi:hypothetical protein